MRQYGSHSAACRPSRRVMQLTQSRPVKAADQNRGLTDIKKEYDTIHEQRKAVSSAHSLMSRPEARISDCPPLLSHPLLQGLGQGCWDWKQGPGRPNAEPFRRQGLISLHEMPGGDRTIRLEYIPSRAQGEPRTNDFIVNRGGARCSGLGRIGQEGGWRLSSWSDVVPSGRCHARVRSLCSWPFWRAVLRNPVIGRQDLGP